MSDQDKQIVEGKLESYDSLLDDNPEVQRKVEKSKVEERQQAVLDVVEARFPALLEEAQQQIVHFDDRKDLKQLTRLIVLAPDETTARWALSAFAA